MQKNISALLLSILAIALLHAAPAGEVKWHPGHYVLVGGGPLKEELLTLPHFRGVQKIFSWRMLEPAEGRYDFSKVRADLDLAKKHGRQLVVQLTYKSFTRGERNCPDYIAGPDYGGGVYQATEGLNPVIWNRKVGERFAALIAAFGREFDSHPNLEAVNLPETAPSARLVTSPQPGVEAYTEEIYFAALKRQMSALRQAFPHTVVIQYTNFPASLLDQFTDFELEIGMGMGGPDVYPGTDPISDPKTGIYRLYPKMAGKVPLGAAVQGSNYSVADRKRNVLHRKYTTFNGQPVVITPEDEVLFSPREHLALARDRLKLNYLFWSTGPAAGFEGVKKMLAEPDLASDPAGGLVTTLPAKAFLR